VSATAAIWEMVESITTPAYKRNILHVLDDGLIMYARVAFLYVNLPRRLVLQPMVGGKLVPDACRHSGTSLWSDLVSKHCNFMTGSFYYEKMLRTDLLCLRYMGDDL